MSYITDIREKVGHDPVMYVGATLLVFNSNNEILMNLRSDTNDWGLPGGGKELYETLEECAIRELKEETSLDTNDLELVTVLSGKEYYYVYPNDDITDCVMALYKVKNYSGQMGINDNESLNIEFFSLDNLPTLIEKRAGLIIDKIKSGEIKL